MKLYKMDADNCILALRNCIKEYENLEIKSKEQYLKDNFRRMRLSMNKTLNLLEREYGE